MFHILARPMHLLILLCIALLLFGPAKFSELGGSLGEGILGFKNSNDKSKKNEPPGSAGR